MRARAAQLQTALEGCLQTLGRALQAAGAPAREMPPASTLPAESDGEARPTAPPAGAPPPTEAPRPAASAAPPEVSSPAPGGPSPTSAPPTEERSERIDVVEAPVGTEDGSGSENTHFGSMGAVPPLEVEEPVSPPPASEPAGTAQVSGAEPSGTAEVAGTEPAGLEAAGGSPVEELAAAPMETESPPRAEPPVEKPEERTQEVLGTVTVQADPITAGGITRSGPATLEIDLRPVKSFADLARVTKLLGRVAPGAQPVDLNLPQQRALFSIRGREPQALASQLQEALPEARVVEREGGLDVLLGEEEEGR